MARAKTTNVRRARCSLYAIESAKSTLPDRTDPAKLIGIERPREDCRRQTMPDVEFDGRPDDEPYVPSSIAVRDYQRKITDLRKRREAIDRFQIPGIGGRPENDELFFHPREKVDDLLDDAHDALNDSQLETAETKTDRAADRVDQMEDDYETLKHHASKSDGARELVALAHEILDEADRTVKFEDGSNKQRLREVRRILEEETTELAPENTTGDTRLGDGLERTYTVEHDDLLDDLSTLVEEADKRLEKAGAPDGHW